MLIPPVEAAAFQPPTLHAEPRLSLLQPRDGLSGVALLSMGKGGFLDTGLGTGPIPPTNPGRLTDQGGVPIRTIIEPERFRR